MTDSNDKTASLTRAGGPDDSRESITTKTDLIHSAHDNIRAGGPDDSRTISPGDVRIDDFGTGGKLQAA